MSRDKQIEEMHLTESEVLANDIAQMCPDLVNSGCGDLSCVTCLAKGLEQIGYRKSEDVAREIFAEIEKLIEPTISALFYISETLVDVSKSHISDEDAIKKIRDYLSGTISSKYRLKKTLAELKKKYIGEDTNVTTNTEEQQ